MFNIKGHLWSFSLIHKQTHVGVYSIPVYLFHHNSQTNGKKNGGGMSRLLICLFCCWPHSVSVYSWPVPAGPACQTRHACMLARPNLSTALSIQYDYHEPTPPPVSGAHMNQYFLQGRKCSLPMGQCHTITLYRPKRQV